MKLLEEGTGVNLHDLWLGSDFLDVTPKAQAITGKRDKFDFVKIRNLCALNETIKKVQRQPIG